MNNSGTTSSSTLSNQPTGDQRVLSDAEQYIREAIDLFLKDPPDTDFQRGYLCALVNVALEGFELPIEGDLDIAHQQTLKMALSPPAASAQIYIRYNGDFGSACDGVADTGHSIYERGGHFTVWSIHNDEKCICDGVPRQVAEACIAEDWRKHDGAA